MRGGEDVDFDVSCGHAFRGFRPVRGHPIHLVYVAGVEEARGDDDMAGIGYSHTFVSKHRGLFNTYLWLLFF